MRLFKSNSEIVDVVEFVDGKNYRSLAEEDNIPIHIQHTCTECGTIHQQNQPCPNCGLCYNIVHRINDTD